MNLMQQLTFSLANKLSLNDDIKKLLTQNGYKETDILEVLVFMVENFIVFPAFWLGPLFFLSILFNSFKLTLIFVLVFIPLRKTLGGWHTANDYICTTISIFTPLTLCILAQNIFINLFYILLIYLFAFVVLFTVGCVFHLDEPVKNETKGLLKCLGTIFLVCFMGLNLILFLTGLIIESNTIGLAVLLVFLSILIAKYSYQNNKGR